jgi:hypothetical protein
METEAGPSQLANAIELGDTDIAEPEQLSDSLAAFKLTITAQQLFDNVPLPSKKDCSRVLDVKLTEDGALHAHMSAINLSSSPKYAALSYVWGDQPYARRLYCN